jgi:septal ring-binding cell division protein DamX
MKRRWCPVIVLAVLAMLVCTPVDARRRDSRRRNERDVEERKRATEPAPRNEQRKPSPVTFLDSLNKGQEVALHDSDFAVHDSPTTATATSTPSSTRPSTASSSKRVPSNDRAPSGGTREVFRIQCAASTQADRLRDEKTKLEQLVRYTVHVMHSAPYYKLLVGNFPNRQEAERALFEVRGLGYPDAWIVRGLAGEGE